MAYLDRLQQGLIGAMQAQNNPSAYLQQREQARQEDAQNVANIYAQATQQAKANNAALQNQEQQMMQAGEQQVKQQAAEEEAKKKKLMSIGLTLATGGMGAGAEAAEAAGATAAELGASAAVNAGAEAAAKAAADGLTSEAINKAAGGLLDPTALGNSAAVVADKSKHSVNNIGDWLNKYGGIFSNALLGKF